VSLLVVPALVTYSVWAEIIEPAGPLSHALP
jgi:hypothetical protein